MEITYEDCHGNLYTEMDTVMVYIFPEPEVELPVEEIICDGDTYTLTGP